MLFSFSSKYHNKYCFQSVSYSLSCKFFSLNLVKEGSLSCKEGNLASLNRGCSTDRARSFHSNSIFLL